MGILEVQADQRLLMPVTREGSKPVDLELVAGGLDQAAAGIDRAADDRRQLHSLGAELDLAAGDA